MDHTEYLWTKQQRYRHQEKHARGGAGKGTRLRQVDSPPKAICSLRVFANSVWMFTRHTSTRPRKKHGITGGSNPMWLLASDIGGTHRIWFCTRCATARVQSPG